MTNDHPALRQGSTTPPHLAMVGAGQMALALASGFARSGHIPAENIRFFDPSAVACERFLAAVPGAEQAASSGDAVALAEIVFLAIKPQHAEEACGGLAGHLAQDATIVSVGFDGDEEVISDAFGKPDSAGSLGISAGGRQITLTIDADIGRVSIP